MNTNIDDKYLLSVVVPAYNEEKNIKESVLRLAEELSKITDNYEIIVVNDGSRDSTKGVVVSLKDDNRKIKLISYIHNKGKGHAIRRGIEKTSGKYVVLIDADLDIHPRQIKRYMEDYIAGSEEDSRVAGVIGSKFDKESKVDYPSKRRFMSAVYYKILQAMFGFDLKDTQTGLKLFGGKLIRETAKTMKIDGFAYDIEIISHLYKNGHRIIPLPIECEFSRRPEESGRIKMKHVINIVGDTIRIFIRDRVVQK